MMEKRCQKGPQKSCFLEQNGDMDLPGSTYPPIIDVLVRCQKSTFLGSAKKRPPKIKNQPKRCRGPDDPISPGASGETGPLPGTKIKDPTKLLFAGNRVLSNTPLGTRPGEFIIYLVIIYIWEYTHL